MRTIVFITLLITLILSACAPAYVAEQPIRLETTRPPRPSDNHVWVDSDWKWQRSTHSYIQKDGYWVVPNRRRTFVPGHWRKQARGYHWVSGQWR